MIIKRKVTKSGQVYKVQCPKEKERRLIINCHDCPRFRGGGSKWINCEDRGGVIK